MVPGTFLVTRKSQLSSLSLKRRRLEIPNKQAANQVMVPVLVRELEKKLCKPQQMLRFMDQASGGWG